MAFLADINRYQVKNENVKLFKAALLTFEEVRVSLQKRYRYDVFMCKCGCGDRSGDNVSKYPFVEFGQGIIDNKLVAGLTTPYPGLTYRQSLDCPDCKDEQGLKPTVCSAIECNPTVINDGLNDVFKSRHSDSVGVLCYKFGLHFDGNRAEPVYLVLAGHKNKWNFDISSVAVIRFPDRKAPPGAVPAFYSFDAKLDAASNRLMCIDMVRDCVENELLATVK